MHSKIQRNPFLPGSITKPSSFFQLIFLAFNTPTHFYSLLPSSKHATIAVRMKLTFYDLINKPLFLKVE